MFKYFMCIGLMALLAGCVSASNKQFDLAQKSVQSGAYQQAFDQATSSLHADISNKKTIALFPSIVRGAYAQKLAEIQQSRATAQWDPVAYAYDRMIAMNQALKNIQLRLGDYSKTVQGTLEDRQAMNVLLGLQGKDVGQQRDAAYQKAAGAHYMRGNQFQALKQYRQANHEFTQTLAFIADYKDAVPLALKSKHLADLADARLFYKQAVQAAVQHDYRAAAQAFAQAESFIPGFKDAHSQSVMYKNKADLADALKFYSQGEQLAEQYQYRSAAQAFQAALGFVPNYRDAAQRRAHYINLANRADARRYYDRAMNLMDQQQFAEAATAFRKANDFVPGFRDARAMADQAASYVQPDNYELKGLVQASVAHGIPLTWLHDVHQGYTEEVKITGIRVLKQGYFNRHGKYWPYRLQVQGSCLLEISKGNEQVLSFDTVVDYRVFNDDFGGRVASFQ